MLTCGCGRDDADPATIAQTVLDGAAIPESSIASPSLLAASVAPPLTKTLAPSGYAVGTMRVEIEVAEGRTIPVQFWYPAVDSAHSEAAAGRPVLDFEPNDPQRKLWERAMRRAGSLYSQRTMHAADAPEVVARDEPFPVVLVSHCNDCVRFAYFELAERLATRGFVVVAPDHVNNTMYDYWNGVSVGVEIDHFLETRRLDVFALTDMLLDPNATAIPAGLRGRIDPERIGMAGHSFGALTTSYASTRDPRIRALAFLTMVASVGDNLPVLGLELAEKVPAVKLSKPAFFLIAAEDEIDLFGLHDIIRQNYADYLAPASLATIADTGHYSVTNICGIDPVFVNGCGQGLRPRTLEPFDFLDIDTATRLTADLVTTYFELQLNGTSASTLDDIAAHASDLVRVEHRDPS